MNLVKWLRKNNKKVMAVVVIVIMFGFIGSDYLQWLGQGRTRRQMFAYFLDNKKITNDDLVVARRELEILKILRADNLLRAQDLGGILLGELLFSERRTSPALINHIKQAIRTNDYRVSDKQISDLYTRSMPNHVYWLLLESEIQQVGIRIPNEDVGNLLGQAIPQLFNGQSYSQLVGSLIQQQGISEELILTTFSKLMAMLQYAQMLCSSENVTSSQIMHIASWENETIGAEFVKFDSAIFAESLSPPAEEKMLEHFDRYKKFSPGTVTEENPYGFGYKLPDRVQLEYIALKLSDVSPTVTPPTQEETEEYYQKNREQLFTEQVPSDPNDPNSPLVKRAKSYAEVANIVSKQLLQNKITSKAEKILQEGRTTTEANWKDADAELTTFSAENLRKMAGDYEDAAKQLTEKYKIKIYAGKTGLLSAADMQTDEHLATLYLQSYGYNPVRLTQVVFAINELSASQLGPSDMPKPRLYENIGPAANPLGQMLKDLSGQIMVIVRVIEAIKASEPEGINQTFSTKTLEFQSIQEPNVADPNSKKESSETQHIYSVKEKVAEDLKRLAAMDTAKSKAEEFIGLATKDGWDIAVSKFNELYRRRSSQNESDPNAFRLQDLANLRRLSGATLQILAVQSSGSPVAALLASERKKQAQFIAQLYSLVPPDSNAPGTLPLIMEFKPDMSFYCLKNLSVNRLWQEDYEKIKARRLFREDYTQSQSLTAVHFSPGNILKRMNFREVDKDKETRDANAPAQSESAPQF
jgi:hypothetical protein